MVVTIHQPEHLPWLGLIDKIAQADSFVILDTVQFEKNYFQNRNKVRSNSEKGYSWLTVPIKKHRLSTAINEIEISYGQKWVERYRNILRENYKKGPWFGLYFGLVDEIVERGYRSLSELNIALLEMMLNEFDVHTELMKASDLGAVPVRPGGNEVIMDICRRLDADTYLAGISGRDYLNLDLFRTADIDVLFHDFKHPSYMQQYEPFMTHMSAIDLLINCGPERSREILFGPEQGESNES